MNKLVGKLFQKGNKLKIYVAFFIFLYALFLIGASYAYYAYQVEEESVIVGNVISINAELDVELVVGNNGKLVPMQDAALSNALNAVGSTNGACVDKYGNLSCQVYKITLTNKGSRLQNLVGTIELYAKDGEGNVYNNLKWRELTNSTTLVEGATINKMRRSVLVSDLTMESKEVRTWYIAVWLSEIDGDQVDTDKGLFGGTVTFGDELTETISGPNAPNLDNGNLIPVYFDETEGTYGSWMKADSNNVDNSWYDYENKMWANAVIVDPTKKETYQDLDDGEPIADADIIAFYVWIPRYKYRVWNITRQGGAENTYAYSAYSTGIDINWENGTESTGNVECTYNIRSAELATNLSDTCIYNGTDTITTTSLNTNYTDAWYTHPAFTFGDGTDKEKTGFWIGKFETSGTFDNDAEFWIAETPTILPDVPTLVDQFVSEQFMTAKNFQNYLSSTVDAHMLTNLEWGAVTYLMHSNYGLCNGTSCQGLYINNSYGTSCYFTGRSGGAIAGSDDLKLSNVYPNDSTSTAKHNCNGYYNYKGYKLDYDTGEPTTKDITKLASTTGNITGVYDLSGGAYEYVMGNMFDSSYAFYPNEAGTAWDGTSWYDTTNSALYSKYYNAYSYGTNYKNASAFNRARLGDATAEVLGSSTTSTGSWKVGSGITGSYSYFVHSNSSWFARGGDSRNANSGPFYFNNGSGSVYGSFRSSIS